MPRMAKDKQGRPLPPNTYHSGGYYRYKLANGKLKTIRDQSGKPVDYDLACQIAERANLSRGQNNASIRSITFWLDKYTAWAEEQSPSLLNKQSWRDRKNEMTNFADMFSHIPVNDLSLDDLRSWWDGMTYDQQHNRQSAFKKWFSWLIAHEVCTLNPFSNVDYLPHLIKKSKPAKKRSALEMQTFWNIYYSEAIEKYPHVRIAMGISLITGMRESDVCALRFDKNVVENGLQYSVGKSVGQRGMTKATHHRFAFDKHPALKKLINEARELSLKHKRCPFVLSYHQKGHREQIGNKEHISQVMPKKLSHDFASVRDKLIKAGKMIVRPGKNPPPFHEIKGLYILIGLGYYSAEEIQQAAAHVDKATTLAYPANHEPVYKDVDVVITEDMIGGKL